MERDQDIASILSGASVSEDDNTSTQEESTEQTTEATQTSTEESTTSQEEGGGSSEASTEQQTTEEKDESESTEEGSRAETSTETDESTQEPDMDAMAKTLSGGKFETYAEYQEHLNQLEKASERVKELDSKPKNERLKALEHFLENNPDSKIQDFAKIDELDTSKMSKTDSVRNYLELKHGLTKTEAEEYLRDHFNMNEEGEFESTKDKISFNEHYENAVKFIQDKRESLYAPIREEQQSQTQETQSEGLPAGDVAKQVLSSVDKIKADTDVIDFDYQLNDKQKQMVQSEVLKYLKQEGIDTIPKDKVGLIEDFAKETASRLFKKEINNAVINEAKATWLKQKDQEDHNPSALQNQDNGNNTQETEKSRDEKIATIFERM